MVIRDEFGEVMGVHASNLLCFLDSLTVEAYAAAKALKFAYDMGFQKVEVEGDALVVVKRL